MQDKEKLGARYVCFECGTKFYDLCRPIPTCPECGVDQREAPTRDLRSMLGKGKASKRAAKEEPAEPVAEEKAEAPKQDELFDSSADELTDLPDEDEEDSDAEAPLEL